MFSYSYEIRLYQELTFIVLWEHDVFQYYFVEYESKTKKKQKDKRKEKVKIK